MAHLTKNACLQDIKIWYLQNYFRTVFDIFDIFGTIFWNSFYTFFNRFQSSVSSTFSFSTLFFFFLSSLFFQLAHVFFFFFCLPVVSSSLLIFTGFSSFSKEFCLSIWNFAGSSLDDLVFFIFIVLINNIKGAFNVKTTLFSWTINIWIWARINVLKNVFKSLQVVSQQRKIFIIHFNKPRNYFWCLYIKNNFPV